MAVVMHFFQHRPLLNDKEEKMKKFMTYLALLTFFATMSLPATALAVTDANVSAAVAGGQAYLVAEQITPVFGTGVIRSKITTSNFPAANNGPAVGDTDKRFVDISEDGNTLTLSGPTVNDTNDVYTRTSGNAGPAGTWKTADKAETLTISGDGTFTLTVVDGENTYTATGTYTYNETEKYLKSGGYWNDGNQTSYPLTSTAFAVAALLEIGYDRNSDVILGGILYILQHVDNDTASDSFGAFTGEKDTYTTGACLIAVSLYNDPGDEMRTIIQNGVAYLLSSQIKLPDDTNPFYGGWSYEKETSTDWADLSNTQFAVMGLWYANRYLGETLSGQAWTEALLKYIQRCHGWYNPAFLVLNTSTSDFPEAFGPAAGTDHMTIVTGADGVVDYAAALTVKMGNNDTLTFTRVKGTGTETSIAGDWQVVEGTTTTTTLHFNGDGTYTATGTDDNGTYAASGTYEVLNQTWNDQNWVKTNHDIWGRDGAFSYEPDSQSFYGYGTMLGAGLWCLGMTGQDTNPMVDIAVAFFADDAHYGWGDSLGGINVGGSGAYYYSVYAMAKGLTATIGPKQKVGGHDWVQDLKDEMVDPANGHIQTVAASDPTQNYWAGTTWGDGGDIMGTSWVLMSLAFADPNVESPHKILADDPNLDNPIKGSITLTVKNGVTISGAIRSAIADAVKGLTVTMPIGAIKFRLNHVPVGGTAEMDIEIPGAGLDKANLHSFVKDDGTAKGSLKQGLKWFKMANGNWKGLSNVPIEIDRDAGVIKVTLRDGGPEDADGVANGIIEDPGAPGIDEGSSGGDNNDDICFIQSLF